MATRKIETTISLDGEQKFKQALASATREMRVMESELKAVSAAYNTNGDAVTYYASKQQILRNQISQQREIISSLERAVEDAGKAYGQSSSQVDGYVIRLNNARALMSSLKKELNATDREVEELGRDSVRAGRQLQQGIGDGAESAENSVRSLMNAMQEDLSAIRTSSAISAVSGLWNMATSAYSSVTSFVESTAEYRRQLSFLEQNAATRGFDFGLIKQQLIEVQGLTGDASVAVEGLSNLLATDMDESQMERAIESLAGAVISFPDTLKFESLADGLQETIATGSATGQFAELLERLGVDVEAFNTALENSESHAGDPEIALAYLAANGMADVYAQWQKNNEAMSEAQQTQAELEQEMAEFGGHLERYIVTPVKNLVTDAFAWVNDYIAGMKADMEAGTLALEPGLGGEEIKYYEDPRGFQSVEEMNAAAVKSAEAAQEQKRRQEEMLGDLHEMLALSKSNAGPNAAVSAMTRVSLADMQTILGYQSLDVAAAFSDKLNEAGDAVKNAMSNFAKEWESPKASTVPIREETVTFQPMESIVTDAEAAGKEAGNAFLAGWESVTWDDAEAKEAQSISSMQKKAGTSNWQQVLEEINAIKPELESAGEDAGKAIETGFDAGTAGMASSAFATGAQAATQLAAGLMSQVSYVAMAGASLGSAAASGMGSASAGGNRGGIGGLVSSAAGVINAVLNIDGQTFGRVTAPYLSSALAVAVQ